MCGMPHRSRTTRTGAVRPAIAAVPDVCATSGGGVGVRAHPASASAVTAAIRYTGRMALKDGLLAEFDHEMGTTRKLLDRVPGDNADRLAWKPHPKSMSLGGICTHLAN